MNPISIPWRSPVTMIALFLFLPLLITAVRPQPRPRPPTRNPIALVASPNDPQMLQAIKYAQMHAQSGSGSNAWSRRKIDGPAVTFQSPGGPITLSLAEIADANELYPYLVRRAKNPDTFRSGGHSSDSGYYDDGLNDSSQWGH